MIKFLKSMFFPDPSKKLQKERDMLYQESVKLQRNGKLREYANVMSRINGIEEQLLKMSEKRKGP